MGTVIQDLPQSNHGSQPRWDRCARADLFAPYRAWRTQGLSERQAAQELQVPRTTLHAWRRWHDSLAICPQVAAFLQSGPGLAFFHRRVMAFPRVGVAVGACGMRLVCLFLPLTGLDRFVAASYGAQQPVNVHIEPAIVAYAQSETPRVAKAMPHKDLPVPQDATFTGGLCLITRDPESHCIIVEPLAQARAQASWKAGMAPALAPLHGRVIPSTSEEAPARLASVEHDLEAHHSPDVLHGQPELVQAVSGPMATKERAAHQAVTEATAQRERRQHDPQSLGEEVDKRRAGRAPTAPSSLEQAAQALDAAPCEHQRLAEPRHLVQASLRGMGQDDHCVDLERGVRRHGPRIVSDISGHLAQMRTVAQQAGLSQSCVERLKKAARVGPKMHATLECVSGSGHTQVRQRDWTPDVSFAMHAKLIPSLSLDRVAQTRTVSDGEPLRERAERLRTPLLQPGGVWSA